MSPPLAERLGLVFTLSAEAGLVANAHTTAQRTVARATQDAATLEQDAKGELQGVRDDIYHVRHRRKELPAKREVIALERPGLAAVPAGGALFTTGGATFSISKAAVESSSYLGALAGDAFAVQRDQRGAISVTDITAEQLQAVMEFLEEGEISDIERFGRQRLLKVAQRYGNDAMTSYVQDPQEYLSEQLRLARIEGAEDLTAIPVGFVRIEAGEFIMGSPEGEAGRFDNEVQHRVTLTRPFLLQRTPVTQAEYQALMGKNPSRYAQCFDAEHRPVEAISWYDAVAYCNALSAREGLPMFYTIQHLPGASRPVVIRATEANAAKGYRLPTEAEWEYAARAGSTEATHGPRSNVAWFVENSGNSTAPVGRKAANAWGLHDMLGNVLEWTADVYGPVTSTTVCDPQGRDTGFDRVIRGGSWHSAAPVVRAAYRHLDAPNERRTDLGMRPARSID